MEEHTEFLLPDVREPIDLEKEEALLGAIASLHARFWESSALGLPAEQLWLPWSDLPRTLIHGDTKVANFAFLPDGRVAAFDWTNLGAAPATLDLGWYLAVNSTRLARGKDQVIARYRELLQANLGQALEGALWERMLEAGIVSGARMLLWSKAIGLREGTAFRREDWSWWAARLTRWSAR